MSSLPLDRSAAMALGIAATAMPFAESPDAEAERWLRILRMHGDASLILSSLGVTEAPAGDLHPGDDGGSEPASAGDEDTVAQVTREAEESARERGTEAVSTRDLLAGVARVYGETFDRVLEGHGTSREELLGVLAET